MIAARLPSTYSYSTSFSQDFRHVRVHISSESLEHLLMVPIEEVSVLVQLLHTMADDITIARDKPTLLQHPPLSRIVEKVFQMRIE